MEYFCRFWSDHLPCGICFSVIIFADRVFLRPTYLRPDCVNRAFASVSFFLPIEFFFSQHISAPIV